VQQQHALVREPEVLGQRRLIPESLTRETLENGAELAHGCL
jgi:hypothetical protein